jgi:hypothetical protein
VTIRFKVELEYIMKALAIVLLLTSTTVFAEEYKAPKLGNLKWKSPNSKIKKDSQWVSDFQMEDQAHPSDIDETTPERKPSSGEDSKTQYWEFKAVK